MDQLRLKFEIKNNSIIYDKAIKYLSELKNKNEGREGEVIFKIHDGVKYWQHRYYRGFILPVIAIAQGEKDLFYLHNFVLKERFLFREVKDHTEIPKKHMAQCRLAGVEKNVDGEIIREVKGYVPSCSTLTQKEMNDFIKDCEAIRDELIDWEITKEAIKMRQLAMVA